MSDLTLSAAFGNYDRIAPLHTGGVRPRCIELRIETLSPTEIFRRMCSDGEFDVSEMSMGAHAYLTGAGENPFVAMPAFPSRAFRHGMVYANVDAGIDAPEDLNGKRIAIYEWGMTALVWIVGHSRRGARPRAAIRGMGSGAQAPRAHRDAGGDAHTLHVLGRRALGAARIRSR